MAKIESISSKGGEIATIIGKDKRENPRKAVVKRYAGTHTVEVGAGPTNTKSLKAVTRLTPEQAEEYAELIYEIAEAARRERNAKAEG